MTTQAKKKQRRKRADSLPGTSAKTVGRVQRTESVDSGTASRDHTVVTEPTSGVQVLDRIQPRTGPDLEVAKPVVARPKKTLDKLYMDTGSLDTLLPGSKWDNIAANLWVDYVLDLKPKETALAELCTVYYKSGKKAQTKKKPASAKTDQVDKVVDFLEKFMEANGQWDYIREQDWFKKEGYVIGIEVNYYANRLGAGALPGFHKDTAGDNVFVNLIFDNDETIEGTEWFADVEEPSAERDKWQKSVLPKAYQADLNRARKDLDTTLGEAGKASNVSGGTVGKHAYVSWVDDLVWHATPTSVKRIVFDVPAAKEAYAKLDAEVDGNFEYEDKTRGGWIVGREIIATMAETPGPHLKKWLDTNNLKPQDIGVAEAKKAWKELYGGKQREAVQRYIDDVKVRMNQPWRITGLDSEASAKDDSLVGSKSITESPVGLSKRRRANSLPPSKELEKVRAKNTPRNFLRTWVRVLPPTTRVPGIDLT